jgi:hypothetical protein
MNSEKAGIENGRRWKIWWAVTPVIYATGNTPESLVREERGWDDGPEHPGLWWVPGVGLNLKDGEEFFPTREEAIPAARRLIDVIEQRTMAWCAAARAALFAAVDAGGEGIPSSDDEWQSEHVAGTHYHVGSSAFRGWYVFGAGGIIVSHAKDREEAIAIAKGEKEGYLRYGGLVP